MLVLIEISRIGRCFMSDDILNAGSEKQCIMKCNAAYMLKTQDGTLLSQGECTVQLDEETLTIMPRFGDLISLHFRDIIDISDVDYQVQMSLESDQTLTVFDLGYNFEDFVIKLYRLRNQVLLKDMLMDETKRFEAEGEYNYSDVMQKAGHNGECSIQLYETALVILPKRQDIKRIPYSLIEVASEGDYRITVKTELGEEYIFSMLGRMYDPFYKKFCELMDVLAQKVQTHLVEVFPEMGVQIAARLARIMKDGKAARKSDIDNISPNIWGKLEERLAAAGVDEEYNFLSSLGQKDKICIGIKRGLMGDLTGEYTWFMVPVCGNQPDILYNTIAMEAVDSEGRGATYFFRLVDENGLHSCDCSSPDAVNSFIKELNYCMLMLNFRREPIYLSEESLNDSKYLKYKYAIRKLLYLQHLRRTFIGRVIHRSAEQWKNDVLKILKSG